MMLSDDKILNIAEKIGDEHAGVESTATFCIAFARAIIEANQQPDWDSSPEFNYIGVDINGGRSGFVSKPFLRNGYYYASHDDRVAIKSETKLFKRPDVEL